MLTPEVHTGALLILIGHYGKVDSVDMKGIAQLISKWECYGFNNFANTTSREEKGTFQLIFC